MEKLSTFLSGVLMAAAALATQLIWARFNGGIIAFLIRQPFIEGSLQKVLCLRHFCLF